MTHTGVLDPIQITPEQTVKLYHYWVSSHEGSRTVVCEEGQRAELDLTLTPLMEDYCIYRSRDQPTS